MPSAPSTPTAAGGTRARRRRTRKAEGARSVGRSVELDGINRGRRRNQRARGAVWQAGKQAGRKEQASKEGRPTDVLDFILKPHLQPNIHLRWNSLKGRYIFGSNTLLEMATVPLSGD